MAVRRLSSNQPKEFKLNLENVKWAEKLIKKYPENRQASAIIPLLFKIQEQNFGWLSEPSIRFAAEMLNMQYIRVLEIATFYTMFNLKPVGKYHLQLCGTVPCMLCGAEKIKQICIENIGESMQVTSDGLFSWIEVECLGACVNAPIVQINQDFVEDLTPETFINLLAELKNGKPLKAGSLAKDRHKSAPAGYKPGQ